MYADRSYYETQYLGTLALQDERLEHRLESVSRKIDSITFNRIKGVGFDNLTPFQQSVIKEVCCQMVDFELEHADLLDTIVDNYSINGVSMSFGNSWNVSIVQGIAIKRNTLELLKQTGLLRRVVS